MSEWLSVKETAAYLGLHPSTVREWADDGRLTVYRTEGGHRRFLKYDLELWLHGQRRAPDEGLVEEALGYIRAEIDREKPNERSWYKKLEREEMTGTMRKVGRDMLRGILMDDWEDDPDEPSIGVIFAQVMVGSLVTIEEAVEAMALFRRAVMNGLIQIFMESEARAAGDWMALFRRVQGEIDKIMVEMAVGYKQEEEKGVVKSIQRLVMKQVNARRGEVER